MQARIFRPAKTAMQSGRGKTRSWVLEFEPGEARAIDPLMGWTGSGDMDGQVRLSFADKDAAIAYARRRGISFQVIEPSERAPKSKSYSENFRFDRATPWTH